MNITEITAQMAERFPLVAEALQINDMQPHSNDVISATMHNYLMAKNRLDRKIADLRTSVSKGHVGLSGILEDILYAEVELEVAGQMLIPIERSLKIGDSNETIIAGMKEFAMQWAMIAEVPRSSSMVHNARAVLMIDVWRRVARDLRLS